MSDPVIIEVTEIPEPGDSISFGSYHQYGMNHPVLLVDARNPTDRRIVAHARIRATLHGGYAATVERVMQ